MTDNVYPLLMVPQDVMLSCAARVRELRIRQNITQKELAALIGVLERTIKTRTVSLQEKGFLRREGGKRSG